MKDDMRYLIGRYDRIKSKLKDNNRLLDKIRNNSQRQHENRSASKHREMEYLTIRKFGKFMEMLREILLKGQRNDRNAHIRDN